VTARSTGIGNILTITREYRQENPRYCERNSLLQSCRNAKARVIATMDALKPAQLNKPGAFYLLPLIATMDASAQKVILIPIAYHPSRVIAKEDSIAPSDLG